MKGLQILTHWCFGLQDAIRNFRRGYELTNSIFQDRSRLSLPLHLRHREIDVLIYCDVCPLGCMVETSCMPILMWDI